MKKKIGLGLLVIGLLSWGLYYELSRKSEEVLINKNIIKENNKTLKGYNGLAIMLQNEKGEYVVSDSDTWQADGYVFNEVLSSCENGGKLSWHDGKITLKTSGSDKCYVYFDKISIIQNNNLQMLLAESKKMNQETVGELLQHTSELPNSANDNGYRYSGNNPNNFICFGAGSEYYNNGKNETCELTNQYRIIGIVPVTTADGKQENLIKVIKSEYITEEELGKSRDELLQQIELDYTELKRIQSDAKKLDAFHWNEESNTWTDGKYNYWSNDGKKATLNETLNGYYLNTTIGNKWSVKIENVKWNISGITGLQTENLANKVKEYEEGKDAIKTITSIDKIGLMYAYDYGFASAKNNWEKTMDYSGDDNRKNNWLFNGVLEWLITRSTTWDYGALHIYEDGSLRDGDAEVFDYSYVVRPVFYLKSSVKLIADNKTDGTYLHPYKVA